jgi:hypothetical protein
LELAVVDHEMGDGTSAQMNDHPAHFAADPSAQLTPAPIVNGVIPAIAALLVSQDFSKPSQPQRRRTPGPRTAASGRACAGPLVRRADGRAALPMSATSEPARSAGPSRLGRRGARRPGPPRQSPPRGAP